MKKRHQNIFFFFGLLVLGIMVTQLDFAQVVQGVSRAGYWFLAVIILWAFLYIINTFAWYIIIRNCREENIYGEETDKSPEKKVGFWWLYKITISGFALNYATPGGLMGGEPYRIMSLAPKIGTERASSSVILYVMTHIFSHFWFWLLSALLYVLTQPIGFLMGIILGVVTVVCVLAISFFIKGYKHGVTVSLMSMLSHFPMIKRWSLGFLESHRAKLHAIDCQTASLHNRNPKAFVSAVCLEIACRALAALEIYFILLVILPSVGYLQCVLILAFTSLIANIFFFMPLQLGGREGGFLLSAQGLQLTSSAGIFVALIVRLRELVWTAIGLMLIKLGKYGAK